MRNRFLEILHWKHEFHTNEVTWVQRHPALLQIHGQTINEYIYLWRLNWGHGTVRHTSKQVSFLKKIILCIFEKLMFPWYHHDWPFTTYFPWILTREVSWQTNGIKHFLRRLTSRGGWASRAHGCMLCGPIQHVDSNHRPKSRSDHNRACWWTPQSNSGDPGQFRYYRPNPETGCLWLWRVLLGNLCSCCQVQLITLYLTGPRFWVRRRGLLNGTREINQALNGCRNFGKWCLTKGLWSKRSSTIWMRSSVSALNGVKGQSPYILPMLPIMTQRNFQSMLV